MLDIIVGHRYGNASMYNKLFTKILDSSVWLEPASTRLVWVTLLAGMDEEGYAHFPSIRNLAHRARVEVAEAKEAIARLEGPDEDSTDPEFEGRRIERVPGGWIVLNAKKYQALATRFLMQKQTRERVRRFRERKRIGNGHVTKGNEKLTRSDTDTEYVQPPVPPLKGGRKRVTKPKRNRKPQLPITGIPPDYSVGRDYVKARQAEVDERERLEREKGKP